MLDLSKLTTFNKALVYAFEPEAFPQSGEKTLKKDLAYLVGQHGDMLNGYLYAQTIVDDLRKNSIQAVTNAQFSNWIKELHRSMGASLLAAWHMASGEFTQEQIVRWNVDADISADIIYYFSEPRLGHHKTKTQLIGHCIKTYQIDERKILPFIDLVERFSKDPSAEIDPSQVPFLNSTQNNFKGRQALYKLMYAYQQSKLNPDEKKSVADVVRVCLVPTAIPQAMDEYVKATLGMLKACDPTNLDDLAAILAESFYQLTEIHPFANANGRVATALMNTLLCGFGYPSILLRHPGDKEDPSSHYAQAISKIPMTREPLTDLIKTRVLAAQQTPFSDVFSEQLMNTRSQVVGIQRRMEERHPTFDFQSFAYNLIGQFKVKLGTDPTQAHFQFLTVLVERALQFEKYLGDQMPKRQFSLGAAARPCAREELNQQLHLLTGQEKWSTNLKNGMTAWFESTDCTTVDKIFDILTAAAIGEISKGNKKGSSEIFCVVCKDIDYPKLCEAAKQNSPKAQPPLPAVEQLFLK